MTTEPTRVSARWLALREPADARARAVELVDLIRDELPERGSIVIHDLGCGTGSMIRWLAPQLPGPQTWIMYDWDMDLLEHAVVAAPRLAYDGTPISVEARRRDVTRLDRTELNGASLITASALLDMLTNDELDRLTAACAGAGCPALLTLSVIGQVELEPADPMDERVADAFNAHQRRTTGGRRLLGPEAVEAAIDAFARSGLDIEVRSSPWRLGADQAALAAEWLDGWIGAAFEQCPSLRTDADEYARRRRVQAASGQMRVTVHHRDLLARPR